VASPRAPLAVHTRHRQRTIAAALRQSEALNRFGSTFVAEGDVSSRDYQRANHNPQLENITSTNWPAIEGRSYWRTDRKSQRPSGPNC